MPRPGRQTQLQAYRARQKARPAGASAATYFCVREVRVDESGKVSLRYDSRLYGYQRCTPQCQHPM